MGSSLGCRCHGICGGGGAASPKKRALAADPPASPPVYSTTASASAAPGSTGSESCKESADVGQAATTWLFSILALAVAALVVPKLADATGLPPWAGRGLVLAAVLLHICHQHGSSSNRSSIAEPEPESSVGDSAASVDETPLEQLKRLLDEARTQFGDSNSGHPSTAEEYKAQGWSCDQTSVSQVYLKFPKDPPPPRVEGDIRLNTIDQVPHFPIAVVNGEGELRGGAGPVYLSVGTWPSWFPFMRKCTKLATLTDNEEIWHVEAQILMFKADAVVMGSYQDHLDELGQLQVVFIAPPAGSEGKQWLGITVPQKLGPPALRVPINKMRLSLTPLTEGSSVVHFQVDHVDILGLEYVVKKVFSVLSKFVVPELRKQIDAFEGSALQAFLRDPQNSRRKELYFEMHQRVRDFVAKRSAAGVGALPP